MGRFLLKRERSAEVLLLRLRGKTVLEQERGREVEKAFEIVLEKGESDRRYLR